MSGTSRCECTPGCPADCSCDLFRVDCRKPFVCDACKPSGKCAGCGRGVDDCSAQWPQHRKCCPDCDHGCEFTGDAVMSELDSARYAAFKRGIGWRLSNPGRTDFHAAAVEYVRSERERDNSSPVKR